VRSNLQIGRAAFEKARRMFAKDLVEFRNGAQIIERNGGTRTKCKNEVHGASPHDRGDD
jgi:hypothetical protein